MGVRYVHAQLELTISQNGQLISTAEIVTQRSDILYGSFRIAMKTTPIPGTCSAFFTYRNDSQELDVEILSSQQQQQPTPNPPPSLQQHWPIHLVAQSTLDTDSSTSIYNTTLSPPTQNYNEYRIDWLPSRVDYYLNGAWAWTETANVPSAVGRLHISHWANGNPLWSGGPPGRDAVSVVSYVKAYFNSSGGRTRGGCEGRKCVIPDQREAPNPFGDGGNGTGRTFFFTDVVGVALNTTQRGPGKSSANVRLQVSGWRVLLLVLLSWMVC